MSTVRLRVLPLDKLMNTMSNYNPEEGIVYDKWYNGKKGQYLKGGWIKRHAGEVFTTDRYNPNDDTSAAHLSGMHLSCLWVEEYKPINKVGGELVK